MGDGFIDLDPATVSAAGRNTAATSSQWSSWAAQVDTLIRDVASAAQEPAVTAAFENHLSAWNPRLKGMATDADALGTNAVTASTVMVNADGTSTGVLDTTAATTHTAGTHLARPLTP